MRSTSAMDLHSRAATGAGFSVRICCYYRQAGRVRRRHTDRMKLQFEAVEKKQEYI